MVETTRTWSRLVRTGLLLFSACSTVARAQDIAPPKPMSSDEFLNVATYRLWSGRAPQAVGDDPGETPTLTVFRPFRVQANGTSVVVAPGGGYVSLAGELEGRQVADWFSSRGITAFVLKYRVGPNARLPVPLLDGHRAMRFVRAHAAHFKLDPKRIGMIGFSAGGHLAAMTAANADVGMVHATDSIDRVSSRPDFLVLGYPWLEATDIRPDGKSWYCIFAGKDCHPDKYAQYSPLRGFKVKAPPTFIYHTTNDSLVPVRGSVKLYTMLQDAKVPVELHAFMSGPHGTGLGGSDVSLAHWPELLEGWLRQQEFLTKVKQP